MLVASATDGFASNCNLYADAPTVNSDGVQIDARSRAYCPSNPGTHTLKSTLVRVLSWMPDSNIKSAYDSVPNSAGDYFATATGCYWGGYTSTWKTVGNITGNGSATSATRQYYCP
jgi:hypothetical protein